MEIIKTDSSASISFAEVRISGDELAVYQATLKFAVGRLDDADLERHFGATRDELEGIREDVNAALTACKDTELIVA